MEKAEAKAGSTLKNALEMAQQNAVHLEELTREEAEQIADYIRRDLNDAAEFLSETKNELGDWLMLDLDIFEHKMLELFLSVADQTRLELEQLREQARMASTYHTGEITGPGTLQCSQCGKLIHFKETGHIPPCPQCHFSEFKRMER